MYPKPQYAAPGLLKISMFDPVAPPTPEPTVTPLGFTALVHVVLLATLWLMPEAESRDRQVRQPSWAFRPLPWNRRSKR